MNVTLVLLRWFPHGGMQRDLLATARRCVAAGHGVRILCHTWDGPQPDDLEVRVAAVPGVANHTRAARFAAALPILLRATEPDVVIGFDKLPGLDLCFCADPCFLERTRHRPWPYRLLPRARTFARLERAVFAPAATTRILLLDARQRDDYRRHHGTPDERFVLLPPGIAHDRRRGDDAPQRRQRGRAALHCGDDDVVLLHLAANAHLKGLDRVLHGMAALPAGQRERVVLVAAGAQPRRDMLRLAQRLGLSRCVRFVGPCDDVPTLLQAADLLVHPARADTTGTVILEAIAAGLPVLCSAACGYAVHVEASGAGAVVPEPFTQPDLDERLRALATTDRRLLGVRALAYSERTDLHGMHDVVLAEVERRAAAGIRG